MALARVGDQPEGSAGTQLQVRHLHAPVDAANDQSLLAPIELERLALLEAERHESTWGVAFAAAPFTGEIGDPAIAASVAVGLDLREQCLAGAAILFDAVGVRLEGLLQRGLIRGQLVWSLAALIARRRDHLGLRFPEPFTQRVAGQPSALRDFMQRQLVAQMHPSNLA